MSIAEVAKAIYDADHRHRLEQTQHGRFVAIEPVSRQAFVAETFVQAALDARTVFPDREPFVLRVGHKTAVTIGSALRLDRHRR